MTEIRQCPKCHGFSGNDWSQCNGSCPMEMSPHYNPPVAGHGYSGEFTSEELFERAADHEKAAKFGMSAGPNVSYVRTFQACAFALRIAAEQLKAQGK